MVPLLLLPLLWGGSLQEQPGYQLRVQKSLTVQEGLCVHVPCSFSYPGSSPYPPAVLYTYWYWRGDYVYQDRLVATNDPIAAVNAENGKRFHLSDPRSNNCSLSIRDARMSDTGIYFVQVDPRYTVKYTYQDTQLNLQVTALTQKPHIRVPEPLESGLPTTLTCSLPGSCEGGATLTFSWEGAAVDSLSPQTRRSSVLTFTPRPQDHGTSLSCLVRSVRPWVTLERSILLNVSYAPRNLSIGVFFRNVTAFQNLQTTSLSILEGEALRLLCVADSNPPAQLSWIRGSPALNATPLSSTAVLELPRVGPADEGELTCHAQHPLGSLSVSLRISVDYPPQLLGPSCSWEAQGLSCSCSSRALPAPSLRWRLGERLLEGNQSSASYTITSSSGGPWTNSSLGLNGGLSSGLRLSCEAGNVHGAQSVIAVLLLPGKPVSQAGVVPAALGGAGAMALLSLCVCLISCCIVKARRKPAAGRPKVTSDEDPAMGTVTWGSQGKLGPDRPPDHVSPAEDAPPSSREQHELLYANLSFPGTKPLGPEDQETTSGPEYSEIKTASR